MASPRRRFLSYYFFFFFLLIVFLLNPAWSLLPHVYQKTRIRDEASLMEEVSRASHCGIVGLVEYFEDRKNFYIVMEL